MIWHKVNNLKNVNVKIPLGDFVCVTGVSGSGKSVFLHTILSVFALREPNAEVIETEITLKHNQLPINFEDMGIAVESLDDNNETIFSVLKKQNTRYFINRQAISKKKLSEISHYFVKYISLKDGNELESDSMLHILDSNTSIMLYMLNHVLN